MNAGEFLYGKKGLEVDLSHFAEKFAGGGHKDAAAFAIRGPGKP
jgi:nanoRNase/pAp phosphatase (c-di-AMP/oligoRNAs hydrolase)